MRSHPWSFAILEFAPGYQPEWQKSAAGCTPAVDGYKFHRRGPILPGGPGS